MRHWPLIFLLGVLGCQHAETPPPVPPMLEDLSTWTVPELVQPTTSQPMPPATEDKPTPAEKVYAYAPGTAFAATVAMGVPLDIMLERGEELRNTVGGDRTPLAEGQKPIWEVREGVSGQGDTQRPHIFLTASEPGHTLGLAVTTTRRSYHLTLTSVQKSPIRIVRWQYPPRASVPAEPRAPGLLPDPAEPKRWHVGYELSSSEPTPDWLPRYIADDGKKTYIIYPEIALFGTVPLVRLIGPSGPQILNARQHLNVVILDQLIARAELRVGTGSQAQTVMITRGPLRTITCPGESECPQFPLAATMLGRRHP